MDMDTEQQYKNAVSDFAAQIYRKGYRGRFTIERATTGSVPFSGTLSQCLYQLYDISGPGTGLPPTIELATHPPYNQKLDCRFKIGFDPAKGFGIREMNITNQADGRHRQYRIDHNHQIPGSQAVVALFPKAKPWERHLKGKLRP